MLIVECPHCLGTVVIEQINCCIFRHGVLKTNGQQINPHASKETIDGLVRNDSIYGCGLPFRLIRHENTLVAIVCDFI